MFPDTKQVEVVSEHYKNDELETTSTNYNHSLIWTIYPSKIENEQFLTTQDLLFTSYNNDVAEANQWEEDENEYVDNTSIQAAPYLIVAVARNNPDLGTDDHVVLIDTPILPTESIVLKSGQILALNALVVWDNNHYTAIVRCGDGYWRYDDSEGDGMGEPYNYQDTLLSDETPLLLTNAMMYFYTDTGETL